MFAYAIDIRGNKMPNVHISIRSNPKGNSIAGPVPPRRHLQYSPRAIVLPGPSMYALSRTGCQ